MLVLARQEKIKAETEKNTLPAQKDPEDNEDETDFQPCADCDLPDACSDFGCAIKKGLREPETL